MLEGDNGPTRLVWINWKGSNIEHNHLYYVCICAYEQIYQNHSYYINNQD